MIGEASGEGNSTSGSSPARISGARIGPLLLRRSCTVLFSIQRAARRPVLLGLRASPDGTTRTRRVRVCSRGMSAQMHSGAGGDRLRKDRLDANPSATVCCVRLTSETRTRWAAELEARAHAYWTDERTAQLLGGKQPADHRRAKVRCCLRALGLMHDDASMPPAQVRKYFQINHMVALLGPALRELRATCSRSACSMRAADART